MAILTILTDAPLPFIKEEDNYSRSLLETNPLTADVAIPLGTFITNTWQPVYLQELALAYAKILAHAQVLHADSVLNGLVKKLDGALLMITNKDRKAPLYVLYFGAERPFEVAAGILGAQLETMRGSIPVLLASQDSTLHAIGKEIDFAVADADAAVKAKADAEGAILVFETTGARFQLVNTYNSLRKVAYGALGKIKHDHPELPNDFADSFFRHESKKADDKLTPEQLQVKIDALSAEVDMLVKKKKTAEEKLKADAEAKALEEQKQAVIDEKKKQQDDLAAEIKKLEAGLKN